MTALSLSELINTYDAELELQKLDRWEKVAALAESDPASYMRSHHAYFYEKQFGFPPEKRHQVREALQQLQQTGRASVKDVLVAFQASGLSE